MIRGESGCTAARQTMITNIRYPAAVVFCFLAFTVLGGCGETVKEQPPPPVVALPPAPPPPKYIRMAPTAPPAPQQETSPRLDELHEIWRPGYWSYDTGQFVWVPGTVIAKPDAAAMWLADHWEKRGFGWAFVPGYWL